MRRHRAQKQSRLNRAVLANKNCKKALGPARALTVWHKNTGYIFATDNIAAIRVDIQQAGKDITQRTLNISVWFELVSGKVYNFEDMFILRMTPKKEDMGIQRFLFLDGLLDLLRDPSVAYINFDALFEELAKKLGEGAKRVRW